MKLPQSVGLKKTKALEQLIDELQLEQRPIATEAACEQFNELRSDMVLLYELHQALISQDYELQTLRHRYESVLVAKVIKKFRKLKKLFIFCLFSFQNIDMSQFDSATSSLANGAFGDSSGGHALLSSLAVAAVTAAQQQTTANSNTPPKRISEIFENSLSGSPNPMERRRKAALNQTNFIKRLRGRNPTWEFLNLKFSWYAFHVK